jgi:hypothetical protein
MYNAGPKHPPLPTYDDIGPSRAERERWKGEESELAEFEAVAHAGACEYPAWPASAQEREWSAMDADTVEVERSWL